MTSAKTKAKAKKMPGKERPPSQSRIQRPPTTLPLVDGSRNITRLAGWRAGNLTLREPPLQGEV
jgi:hypothetical protein